MPLLIFGSAETPPSSVLVTPLPEVRVLWRPDQFNRCSNPGFETNTTGWSVASVDGIAHGATSITRITTDQYEADASASVVTNGNLWSGVSFAFTDRAFAEPDHGTVYVARARVKWVSGPRRVRVALGPATSGYNAQEWDLGDGWKQVSVRWAPSSSTTTWYLGFAAATTGAMTFRIDAVEVYQTDDFSQVENGSFETDTVGWVVTAGSFAAAATSITRQAGGFGGDYCARVVTSAASATSGTTYDLGYRVFTSGRTYRLRLAARTVSGSAEVAFQFGSPAAADSATSTVTLTSDFAWYTVDWTPGADRTDVEVCVRNTTAASRTLDIDEVELYEAIDDLGTDAGDLTWERGIGRVGTATIRVENADGRYSPRNASSPLYGMFKGRRVMARATYSDALWPLFYGTLVTVEPQPFEAKADLIVEDPMADLRRARVSLGFIPDESYATIRERAMRALVLRNPRTEDTDNGTSHNALTTRGLESSTLYAGTDDLVPVAEVLADIDEATQSVSWARPSVHANIGWKLVTVDRATLTDTSSDFNVDEDFEALDNVRLTHEAMENLQVVPWQAYELAKPAPNDFGNIVQAYDVVTHAGSDWLQADQDPYLHFTREEYGDSLDVPEPSYRLRKRWKRRPKGRKLVVKKQRIYPDAFAPYTIPTGTTRDVTIDFAVAVQDMSTGKGFLVRKTPTSITVRLYQDGTWLNILGTPYTVLEEQEVEAYTGDGEDVFDGPSFGTPFIPSLGAAEGVAAYRNWRYGQPRLRPTLTDRNEFPRTLTADLTDHITLSADRWYIDAALFVVLDCTWSVTRGGLDWRVSREIEELPSHTEWFTLDDATKGLDDAVVLAY